MAVNPVTPGSIGPGCCINAPAWHCVHGTGLQLGFGAHAGGAATRAGRPLNVRIQGPILCRAKMMSIENLSNSLNKKSIYNLL